MNLSQLKAAVANGEIIKHHTSLARGYLSRKGGETQPSEYKGIFGNGFTTACPNFDSTRYLYINYYIYA